MTRLAGSSIDEVGSAGYVLHKPHSGPGHAWGLSLESVQLIEALRLRKHKLFVAAISRKTAEMAKRERGVQAPAYDLVHDIVRQNGPGFADSASMQGSQVYRRRSSWCIAVRPNVPNAIWQADHTPLDIELREDKGQRHQALADGGP